LISFVDIRQSSFHYDFILKKIFSEGKYCEIFWNLSVVFIEGTFIGGFVSVNVADDDGFDELSFFDEERQIQ
jgi:hypothetical protein